MYKHDGNAILVFCFLAMLCLSVFLAFYRRNLKPAVRKAASMLHISRQIAAEVCHSIARSPPLAPARAIRSPRKSCLPEQTGGPPMRAGPRSTGTRRHSSHPSTRKIPLRTCPTRNATPNPSLLSTTSSLSTSSLSTSSLCGIAARAVCTLHPSFRLRYN